ncbi:S-4TM family putative pore-forming effector [Spirillospora sp. NPDC048911]|uniref:S-4TM family putative pore-forming effector n=1 Tax=Spirillospora sp. NPDC048911 TaxID=3364527 RepID=UPI00371EE44E
MSQPQSSIIARQDAEPMLTLLRAMTISHQRVQRLEGLRMIVSVGIAGGGLVAAFVDAVAPTVTVIGVLWALAYTAGLAGWANRELRRAAVVQEAFDVRLFRLPWNGPLAGEQVGAQEVSQLSSRFKGQDSRLQGYYEVPALVPPYDVLACQVQNLGWGARVRRRYANVLVTVLAFWVIAGVAVGVLTQMTLGELLLRWYIPALGVLLVGLEAARGQRSVAADRERVLTMLRGRLDRSAPDHELEALARQIQDVLLLTRQRVPRVPDWFFSRFQGQDRRDFQAAMNEFVEVVQAHGRS